MPKTPFPITLFGHRGAKGEAPENTLLGFDYAWQIGIRAFELDVQLTKDTKLAVIHDPTLCRTTNKIGRVIDHTATELKTINACLNFPTESKSIGIPLLEEVIKKYKNRIDEWQIEIKTNNSDNLRLVCNILRDQIGHFNIEENVTVTSFDPRALHHMHDVSPNQKLGLIQTGHTNPDIELALKLGCQNICIPIKKCTSKIVELAHSLGLNVTGWLGNTPLDILTLLETGADSITSDMPSIAFNFLRWYFQSSNQISS